MISFRYYLITIVAIFLALGLGVLAGSTVLDQGLVNSLQAQTNRLKTDLGDLRGRVNDLTFQVDKANEFSDAVVPIIARGRLVGRQVVVVTDQGGIDGGSSDHAIAALRAGGADIVTALRIDPRIGGSGTSARDGLAAALGLPASTAPRTLDAKAASALAHRLAVGEQRPADDVLSRLEDSGLVTQLIDAAPTAIGGANQAIVVVHGGGETDLPHPSSFLLPLVDDLVRAEKMNVAATEALAAQPQFVEELRGSSAIGSNEMVTVDNVDQGMGQVALVAGLQQLIEVDQGGAYGVKVNADDVTPPLSPSP
jgi:Copper transport outer membrane protein, MctB